jgi:hypothetical protein
MKGIWIAAQSECRITNCNFVGCTVNGKEFCLGDKLHGFWCEAAA